MEDFFHIEETISTQGADNTNTTMTLSGLLSQEMITSGEAITFPKHKYFPGTKNIHIKNRPGINLNQEILKECYIRSPR
jgi:hypothetical protein